MAIDVYYPGFDCIYITDDGTRVPAVGDDVDFYNITQATVIDTFTVPADGIIEPGGFDSAIDDAAVGDIVELRVTGEPGTLRFVLQSSEDLAFSAATNDAGTYVVRDDYTSVLTEAAVILAVDLDEPDAPPIVLGGGKPGDTIQIPFQSNVAKNLRLYVAPADTSFQFAANDLTQLDFTDIAIPAGSSGQGITPLFDFVTDATTTGTASETLYDGEIAANTLMNNGEAIKVEAAGTFAANTNTKIIWCEVGGTQINDASTGVTSNGKDWVLDGLLIREDADTLKYYIEQTVDGETVKTDAGKINSLDFTAAIDFTFRGRTPTNAGDLTAYFWKAYKLPAAPVIEEDIIDGGNSTAAYTDIIDGGNSTAAYTDIIDGGAS